MVAFVFPGQGAQFEAMGKDMFESAVVGDGGPAISEFGLFRAPVKLTTPIITRDAEGTVTMTCKPAGPSIRYTLDGSEPTMSSNPITFAPSIVAISKILSAEIALESFEGSLWIIAVVFINSNISPKASSVPSPTVMPAFSIFGTGAIPAE